MSLKFSRLSFLWTSKASTCKLSGEFGLRPACQLQKTAVDWPCPVSTLAVDRGGGGGVTGSKSTWRIIISFLISYCCFFFP